MIVKDESKGIVRCLNSVKHLIDYWVIVDTGSTDGTQEIILDCLKDVPGELHESAWKNYGENREEALQLAKGKADYILFMDGDDILQFDGDFDLPPLCADAYYVPWTNSENSSFTYLKPQIVRASLPWHWIGVVHEYLRCDVSFSYVNLEKVKYLFARDGTRYADPKKYLKNAQMLEEALKKEPHNVRYVFYLGESYRDAGEKGKALEWYQKRAAMGGWDEEVFWSKLQIGNLLKEMGAPLPVVIACYEEALLTRIHRPEPFYFLVEIYNQTRQYQKAYDLIKGWMTMPQPLVKDRLFTLDWIADFGMLFQLSIAAYWIGEYQEALDACNRLLEIQKLPASWRICTENNRVFPLEKLRNFQ